MVDLAVTKKLRHGVEWNLSVDNLNNKHYYETQNFFDSRVIPTARPGGGACGMVRRVIPLGSPRGLRGGLSEEPER